MHLLRWLGWWLRRRGGWGRRRQGQAGQLDRLQGWRGRGLTLLGRWAAPFLGTAGGPGPLLGAAGAPLAVGWCLCGERERDVGKVTVTPNAVLISPFHFPSTLAPEPSFQHPSQTMPWRRT